jgi:uncharacterized protein
MTFRDSRLQFGKIIGVEGNKITVNASKLDCEFNESNILVEVGTFANCGGANGDTICIINKIMIQEIDRKVQNSLGESEFKPIQVNIVEISIIGHLKNGVFERGVERLPTIYCDCFLLSDEQTNTILETNIIEKDAKKYFKVTGEGQSEVYFNIDKLFGRHFAILGTTGSGKSWAVASIVQSVLNCYNHPRILFFDLHNEYPNAFGHGSDSAKEYKEKTNCTQWSDFTLPYWFMDLEEFIGIYHPDAGSSQKAEIKKIIVQLKTKDISDENLKEKISVDTPIFFDIDELINEFEKNRISAGTAVTKSEPWEKLKLKFESINKDTRFNFLRKAKDDKITLEDYFENLLGLTKSSQKYLQILDLSGLPSEVRNVCIGVLARLCFDYVYWDYDPEHLPFALVLEEAHSYIPEEESLEFALCRKRIERIAKEGRKYGLSLIVVSQRPSSISSTVLSQCGTFITLRLTSDLDQNKVKRFLPDTIESQASSLPSLRDGEAFVSGDAIKLPRKVQFRKPIPTPKSNDVKYHKSWTNGIPDSYNLKDIIKNWKLNYKQPKE